jgi:hypothetical protein
MRKEWMMARAKKAMPSDMVLQASVLRARRALDEMRFVKKSVDDGLSQDVVAEALGASQATISRIIKKVASDPDVIRPTVTEVVNRAVVKEITRRQMVDKLRGMRLGYARPDRKPDSDWAEFSRAVRHGLITKREASVIAEDVAAGSWDGQVTP